MTGATTDPYDVLGLTPDAGQAEITSAYRALLRRHHPDTRDLRSDPEAADAALRKVIAAYLLLSDPQRPGPSGQREGRPAAPVPGPIVRVSRRRGPGPGLRSAQERQPEPLLRAGPVRWHRGGESTGRA